MALDQPDDIDRALHDKSRMPLGDHLEDLRRRIWIALAGPVVAALVTLFFGRDLVGWLVRPLVQVQRSAGLPPQTYNFTVTGGFTIYLKVSLVAALIIAAPWIIYQLWKFIQSGLYQHERRAALVLLPFSTIMAALGVAFLYYILLPLSLVFLIFFSMGYPPPPVDAPPSNPVMQRLMDLTARASGATVEHPATQPTTQPTTQPSTTARDATLGDLPVLREDPPSPRDGQAWLRVPHNELRVYFNGRTHRFSAVAGRSMLQPIIGVREYINFVALMAMGIVVVFRTPVVMLILGYSGIIEAAEVARARKYCVFGCFALAAVFTPSDPISMMVLALPLWVLFEFGLILMRLAERRAASDGPAV